MNLAGFLTWNDGKGIGRLRGEGELICDVGLQTVTSLLLPFESLSNSSMVYFVLVRLAGDIEEVPDSHRLTLFPLVFAEVKSPTCLTFLSEAS